MDTFDLLGHSFITGRCACGYHWPDIRNAAQSNVGQKGWLHDRDAELQSWHVTQIERQRETEDKRLANGMKL